LKRVMRWFSRAKMGGRLAGWVAASWRSMETCSLGM
jgi:hypothetical protein